MWLFGCKFEPPFREEPDAGGHVRPDAGEDAGEDARHDASIPDGAVPDAPPPDSAPAPDAAIADAAPPDAQPCAVASHEAWTGTASRQQGHYPDNISAAPVTWTRTSTQGCIDTFAPSGTVHYGYGIPGALCDQWVDPADHPIAVSDGTLTIDRSGSPATFSGYAASSWTVTWYCRYDDGSIESDTFVGGGAWFDASGAITGDSIAGEYETDDAVKCGPNGIAPCTYSWSFSPDDSSP